jgi:ABC-type transporter MlaC component
VITTSRKTGFIRQTVQIGCFLLWAICSSSALHAEEPTAPSVLIQSLFEAMNTRLKADQDQIAQDRTHLVKVGDEVLAPYVAFDRMAQRILGKHWKDINDDQQQRYTQAFRNRVASTLAAQYNPTVDYDLNVMGERRNDRGNQAIVRTEVMDKSTGKKYAVDYSFLLSQSVGRWMVYDIAVEGVSVLQSFRTATAEDFGRHGIEYLIQQLENREPGTESGSTDISKTEAAPSESI